MGAKRPHISDSQGLVYSRFEINDLVETRLGFYTCHPLESMHRQMEIIGTVLKKKLQVSARRGDGGLAGSRVHGPWAFCRELTQQEHSLGG
jgi:hypothetical protein